MGRTWTLTEEQVEDLLAFLNSEDGVGDIDWEDGTLFCWCHHRKAPIGQGTVRTTLEGS